MLERVFFVQKPTRSKSTSYPKHSERTHSKFYPIRTHFLNENDYHLGAPKICTRSPTLYYTPLLVNVNIYFCCFLTTKLSTGVDNSVDNFVRSAPVGKSSFPVVGSARAARLPHFAAKVKFIFANFCIFILTFLKPVLAGPLRAPRVFRMILKRLARIYFARGLRKIKTPYKSITYKYVPRGTAVFLINSARPAKIRV